MFFAGVMRVEMRIILLFMVVVYTILGFTNSANAGDGNKWYIDLGGKTVDVLGAANSLTGVRAGVVLPNRINIGAAAFKLTKEAESSENNTYKRQKSFGFIGMHMEYSYFLSERFVFNPGVLAGTASGRYEEQEGDVYGIIDNTYFTIEPSLALSARVIKGMWLNLGVSYFLIDSDMGIGNGPMFNIFARYMW